MLLQKIILLMKSIPEMEYKSPVDKFVDNFLFVKFIQSKLPLSTSANENFYRR